MGDAKHVGPEVDLGPERFAFTLGRASLRRESSYLTFGCEIRPVDQRYVDVPVVVDRYARRILEARDDSASGAIRRHTKQ